MAHNGLRIGRKGAHVLHSSAHMQLYTGAAQRIARRSFMQTPLEINCTENRLLRWWCGWKFSRAVQQKRTKPGTAALRCAAETMRQQKWEAYTFTQHTCKHTRGNTYTPTHTYVTCAYNPRMQHDDDMHIQMCTRKTNSTLVHRHTEHVLKHFDWRIRVWSLVGKSMHWIDYESAAVFLSSSFRSVKRETIYKVACWT